MVDRCLFITFFFLLLSFFRRLDIAMFSITRRLRSIEATADVTGPEEEEQSIPPFLSDASDYDLANITMTAIQAEREEILQTQEEIQRNVAKRSYEEAKLLSRRTRVREGKKKKKKMFSFHLSSSSFFFLFLLPLSSSSFFFTCDSLEYQRVLSFFFSLPSPPPSSSSLPTTLNNTQQQPGL